MIITTNGNTEVSVCPGRSYVFTVAGTFGGGAISLLWKDQAGNYVVFDNCTLAAAGKREVIAPFNDIRVTVAGATSPSLNVDIVSCASGSTESTATPGTAGNPSSSVTSVQGFGYSASVAITRPANTTAYSANDAVGDTGGSAILTFANIGPSSGKIFITGATLRSDIAAVPSGMANMRLHLYNASPTAIADNAAWDLVSGDRTKYLGYIDLGTPADFGSTLFVQADQINKEIVLATSSLFGILVTTAGFTPANNSEVYNVGLLAVGI